MTKFHAKFGLPSWFNLRLFCTWIVTELFEDEGNLEQYSPLLGEDLIDYPILEEYGIPTLEEFPAEDDDDDEENDVNEGADSSETEQKAKKGQIKNQGWKKCLILADKVWKNLLSVYSISLNKRNALLIISVRLL